MVSLELPCGSRAGTGIMWARSDDNAANDNTTNDNAANDDTTNHHSAYGAAIRRDNDFVCRGQSAEQL